MKSVYLLFQYGQGLPIPTIKEEVWKQQKSDGFFLEHFKTELENVNTI